MRVTRQANSVPQPVPLHPAPRHSLGTVKAYVPHRTGGKSGEQGPRWAGSMEELTRAWRLQRPGHALPGAWSPCSGADRSRCLVQPRQSRRPGPGRAQGRFRGSLGLAQLDSRCRKLKRQERQREGQGKERKKGREGERRTRRAPAPDTPGLPALALGRAVPGAQVPEAAEGR